MKSELDCRAGVSSGSLRQRVRRKFDGGWGRKPGPGRMLSLGSLGVLAVLAPLMAGLLFGQAAEPAAVSFDAIAIHAVLPGSGKPRFGLQIDPQHLQADNMSLRDMILAAWELQPYQLQGPDWMARDRFTVSGETRTPVAASAMLALLQPFLTRQFDLKMHTSSAVRSVYRLEAVPGRTKLKPAKSDPTPGATTPMQRFSMHVEGRTLELTGTATLQQLVDYLNLQLDRPVLNESGQTGRYDIQLTFDPKAGMAWAPAGGGPSIFLALQEQLGLRLVSGKAPVKVLVVDSAHENPSGN